MMRETTDMIVKTPRSSRLWACLLGMALAGWLILTGSAQAFVCLGCQCQVISKYHAKTSKAITKPIVKRIEAADQAVNRAINQAVLDGSRPGKYANAGAISTLTLHGDNIVRTLNVITDQWANIHEAMNQSDARLMNQLSRAAIAEQFLPTERDECASGTGTEKLAKTKVSMEKVKKALDKRSADHISGLDPASDLVPLTEVELIDQAFVNHMSFCNPASFSGGQELKDVVCPGGVEPVDADIRPGVSLFGKNSLATEEDMLAAVLVTRNLVDPVGEEPSRLSEFNNVTGEADLLQRKSGDARQSLSYEVLNHMVALRSASPGQGGGNWVRDVLGGLGFQKTDIPDDISYYETLETMLGRRMESPRFSLNTEGNDPTNRQRDLAELTGELLLIRWSQYEMFERLMAVRAARLAVQLERLQVAD